jgi:hypothetical protein
MANVVRGMVDGIGIANTLPENPKYFTEEAIAETVVIPTQKPDMEQLLSVMEDIEIISIKVVNTPVAISNEGQRLQGNKLIIEINLKQKIKYVADEPTQSVHAAHFEKMKSIFVVVPTVPPGQIFPYKTVTQLLNEGRVDVTPYIEDIYGEMKDKRTIFKNTVIFLNVTFRF